MIGLIRWILGYVKFVAKGMFPERFMNMIAKSNISIWNVKRKGDELSACVVADEYKEFKGISRKTGTKIKLLEKHGFPFIINKYKKRKGILIGILLFSLFLYILSLYIWEIDITGDVPDDTTNIESVISDLGLTRGCIKSNLDLSYIEQKMMIEIPSISWASINIKGSLAEVAIKQRKTPPSIVPKTEPCNIKSSMDAQIVRMEIYNGTPVVNDGDAVVKGQLLVSGVFEDKWGGNAFRHADAKIWAYTKKNISSEIELNQEKHIPTDKIIKRRKMKVFGIEVPLSLVPIPKGDYSKNIEQNDLCLFGQRVPISFYNEVYTKEIIEPVVITEEEAKNQAEDFLKDYEENTLRDVQILGKEVTGFIADNKYIVNARYECQENIAYQEKISIE